LSDDTQRARDYFDALAPEYNRAFRLAGRNPLSAAVNRLFRGRTFARRMRRLEATFRDLDTEGLEVLDLGCGSGQVSLLAASMGARVRGIDIAPRMLAIARDSTQRLNLAERVRFEEGDVAVCPLPEADVVLLIGVVEYYRDFATIIHRAAAAARRQLIVAHTTRVAYRMLLRRILFRLSGARVYFHPMDQVIAVATAAGLALLEEQREHAFSILRFGRRG